MTSVQKRGARTVPLRELTATTTTPIASVSANLMPPEVTARRRLNWVKRRLGFALLALVALIALGYAFAHQSTVTAQDDLAAAQQQTANEQKRISGYADVVRIQAETTAIRSQLAGIMSGDLQWSALLASVNRVAPRGLVATDASGTITTDAAAAPATPGADPGVGTLSLSGTAKDYASVAAYVDALSKVRGFGSVEPGALGNAGSKVTFTVELTITKPALGGRFTTGVK